MKAWFDFGICFFFGTLGVHKFREKKTGMGVLYLFTAGLFGFGWIYDCIRYALVAVNASQTPVGTVTMQSNATQVDVKERQFSAKTILLWFATVLFILFAVALLPGVAGFAALAVVAVLIPIKKWQALLSKYLKKAVRIALAVVLSIVMIATAPVNTAVRENLETLQTLPSTMMSELSSITLHKATTTQVEAVSTTVATTASTTVETTSTTAPTTKRTTALPTTTVHYHTFKNATCTSAKTCSSCGAVEGTALGHTWHDATCTSPKTCEICGKSEGYATGHSFYSGKCSVCGTSDPNYVSEEMVWIPNSGSKYHSRSSCSKMKNPTQVPLSTAKARGYTPCSKCY